MLHLKLFFTLESHYFLFLFCCTLISKLLLIYLLLLLLLLLVTDTSEHANTGTFAAAFAIIRTRLLVSDHDCTKQVAQRSIYLWQTKILFLQESIKTTKKWKGGEMHQVIEETSWWLSKCPSEQKEMKDNETEKHVWRREINERSKVDMASGFRTIFIMYCSGLHLVFSLFLYNSSERERDRNS